MFVRLLNIFSGLTANYKIIEKCHVDMCLRTYWLGIGYLIRGV